MVSIRACLAFAVALAPISAQAQVSGSRLDADQEANALRLAPSSPWNLDYDDDSCALRGTFGEEGQQVYLELRQFDPYDPPQAIIGTADFEPQSPALALGWLPARQPPTLIERSFELSGTDGYHGRLANIAIPVAFPEERAREIALASPVVSDAAVGLLDRMKELEPDSREAQRLAADNDFFLARFTAREALFASPEYLAARDTAEREATALFVGEAFERSLVLETGEMHGPMEAMRACVDELLTHWNLDAEAHGNLTRRAWPADYPKILRSVRRAYPNWMEARRIPGYVRARLDVSAKGQPTACHIQLPMSEPDFEREACEQLMDEAEFFPALDADGDPIASYYAVSIFYIIN